MTSNVAESGPDENRLVGSDRVLAVLTTLADYPTGISLDELSQELQSPKSTVHRALTALRRAGFAARISRGSYVLGDDFFRLAFTSYAARPEESLIRPVLQKLADEFGETAHYVVLDGSEVVYRAKVDAPGGSVRLTSVIGGRNPAYRTAVGKLLLSERVKTREQLRDLLGTNTLERRTPNTIVDMGALWAEIEETRNRRYAVDDQENEVGVNCVAIAAPDLPSSQPGAISVSALAFRTPLAELVANIDHIRSIARGGRDSSSSTG